MSLLSNAVFVILSTCSALNVILVFILSHILTHFINNNHTLSITVWLENLTGIKFDEIASKLHNKNMMDFNLTKCPVRRHIA